MTADTFILSQYRVWVMRPEGSADAGYTYPWTWSRWTLQRRLIVKGFSPQAGGMGTASLELLRQTRQDERDNLNRFHGGDVVVPRAWVAISIADPDAPDDINTNQLDPAAIEWWGFLGDLPGTIVEGTDERIGMMVAKEIGYLFDDISLGSFAKKSNIAGRLSDDTENGHGWCQASSDGSYPAPVNTPPTANIRTKDGDIIGNAKAVSGGGYQGYVFARLPKDCGTAADKFWTRWRLIGHIINYCKPLGLPKITTSAGGASGDASISVSHIQSVQPGSESATTPPASPSTGDSYQIGTGATGAWAGHDGQYAAWSGTAWTFTASDPSPSAPSAGDSYLVNTGATGDWSGHDNEVATWSGTAWTFTAPANGTDLAVTSTGAHLTMTADGWESNPLVTYLDDTSLPEVYELRNLKYRGALDMLFPFTQGLDYKFAIGSDKVSWVINIYSGTDTSDYGVPAATLEDVDLAACEDVEVALAPALADRPDEIAFEGAACLFGFSVSDWNRNLDQAWTDALATKYGSANDEERQRPEYEDVFTLFQLKPNDNGDLRRSNTPGDTATDDGPLLPNVVWDGTNAKLGSTSRCPYLPTARLANFLPWEAGRSSDGTDNRDDTRKAQPTYLKPMAHYWDHNDPLGVFNLLDPIQRDRLNVGRPEVSADDRAAAIRMAFSPPHVLAFNHYDPATAKDLASDANLDWQYMILTAAMPSDQRVRVVKRRQVNGVDLDDAKVITRLTIRDETLGFWCMLKGTLVGIDKSGANSADRITATNIDTDGGGSQFGYSIRNDWAKVERNAKRLAAWAFRDRAAGSLSFARPDTRPSWLRVGAMIGTVNEAADNTGTIIKHTVNALIRSYEVTLDASPRIVVSLETLPLPTFIKGIGPVSPASGGAVSPNMGGTVPQSLQQLQARVNTIEADSQRRTIIPPIGIDKTRRLQIIGGQTSNGVPVITYAASDPSLTQLYDPDVDTTYPDGMGRAWLIDAQGNQLRRVLVRHDFGGDTDYLMGASPSGGWIYEIRGTRVLTVASGTDMGKTMTCYLIGWVL